MHLFRNFSQSLRCHVKVMPEHLASVGSKEFAKSLLVGSMGGDEGLLQTLGDGDFVKTHECTFRLQLLTLPVTAGTSKTNSS